jgi:hypothetical protein
MYSGTTLRDKSGNIFGVHQRINRVARRIICIHNDAFFPLLRSIQHFEGKNGPDGIKSKRPGLDEPWHFIDPASPANAPVLADITSHLHNLTESLLCHDEVKSGFEAAWLSHAITDSLTPAHHFPLEETLEDLRGDTLHSRDSYRKKLVIPGENRRDKLQKNWEFWGAKGVMTSHLLFEWGVASTTMTIRSKKIQLMPEEIEQLKTEGFLPFFFEALNDINNLHMYETFHAKGWTPSLARQTKNILLPRIIHTVALAWYKAILDASLTKKN